MDEDGSNNENGFINKIKDYVKQNKFLSISIIILVVMIIVLVAVYVVLGQKKASGTNNQSTTNPVLTSATNTPSTSVPSTTTNTSNTTVDVLPQTERTNEESFGTLDTSGGKDPFSKPAILKGTILNDKSGNLAIIDVGGSTYTIARGEILANIWTVKSIKNGEVVLLRDNVQTVLKISDDQSTQQTGTAVTN
jgi:hypothetical protein